MISSKGFTLIETMVVIVLISILASASMLSITSQNSRSNRALIESLSLNIGQAWLWSELNNQSTRVRLFDDSYEIKSWNKDQWAEDRNLNWARTHTFSQNMSAQLISGSDTKQEIIFFAGGQYQPFELEASVESQTYLVIGDGFNQPKISSSIYAN